MEGMKKLICLLSITFLFGGCGFFAPLFLRRNWGPKIENWRVTTALPEASNDFGCFESGGRLYIINSCDSDYYAAINTDGTLGDWVETGASVSPDLRTSSTSYNGFVYSLAGTTVS